MNTLDTLIRDYSAARDHFMDLDPDRTTKADMRVAKREYATARSALIVYCKSVKLTKETA